MRNRFSFLLVGTCSLLIILMITDIQAMDPVTHNILSYGISVFHLLKKPNETSENVIRSIINMLTQNKIIRGFINDRSSSIKEIFCLTNKTEIMYNYVSKIRNVERRMDYEYDYGFKTTFLPANGDSVKERADYANSIILSYKTSQNMLKSVVSRTLYNNEGFTDHTILEAVIDGYDPMHNNDKCRNIPSFNQKISILFNSLLLTLIKGYSILLSSYYHLHFVASNNETFTSVAIMYRLDAPERYEMEIKNAAKDFKDQVYGITTIARHVMNDASRDIFRRDPDVFKEGFTYRRLTHFIQGYITGEQYLTANGVCSSQCSSYKNTIHHHDYSSQIQMSEDLKCTGRIHDCRPIAVEKICLSPPLSKRRYEALITTREKNHIFYGQYSYNCTFESTPSIHERAIVSPRNHVKNPSCSLCACYCDDNHSTEAVRYISLRKVTSNVQKNYVVTGIRFKIIGQVISLQIKEGKLVNGVIDSDKTRWVEVLPYDVKSSINVVRLSYDQRKLYLDDLRLPDPESVVTGIKFKVDHGIVKLAVAGHPIDKNGILNTTTTTWYSNLDDSGSRENLNLENTDIPIRFESEHKVISKPSKFWIKFGTTDWNKDVSQNVVPFFDVRTVVTEPAAPISGVGIYHRGQIGSGGYLAPKLISLDYADGLSRNDMEKKLSEI